jgi:hypothetical protein
MAALRVRLRRQLGSALWPDFAFLEVLYLNAVIDAVRRTEGRRALRTNG